MTCPICGSDTDCYRLVFGGKITYFDCHRRWLTKSHTFQSDKVHFRKDVVVRKGPPKRLSGPEIADQLDNLVLNETGDGYIGFEEEHNWTHICGIWELPYAKALILMHNINIMHQERNFAESVVSSCLDLPDKTKDNIKARRDLASLCNRPSLELTENGGRPCVPFCLT